MNQPDGERERLTALGGLAARSLDALSSVADGPEAILVVLVTDLRRLESEDKYHRLVVLIPEVQPTGPFQWLLHNQRGIILDHAIRRNTANVVLCRLRYRLETLAADPAGATEAASGR